MENATTAVRPHNSRPAKVKRCKYGDRCRTYNCKFRHSDPAAGTTQPPTVASSDAQKSCRFGAKCRKANCKFSHPATGNPVEQSTENQRVPKKNKKKCRYGLKCNNAHCTFQHPTSGDSLTAASTVPSPTSSIPLALDVDNTQRFEQESSSQRRDDLDLDGLLREQERQRLEDTMQLDRGYLQPFSASSPMYPPVTISTMDYNPALQQQAAYSPHEEPIRPQARHPHKAPAIVNDTQANADRKPHTKKPKNAKPHDPKQKTKAQSHDANHHACTNSTAPACEPKNFTNTGALSQSKSSNPRSQPKRQRQHRAADQTQEQVSNQLKPAPFSPQPSASRKAKSSDGNGALATANECSNKPSTTAKVHPEQSEEQQSPPKMITVPDTPDAAPYVAELHQLMSMGFEDETAVQVALERSEGSVKDAIEILLMSPVDQLREMGYTDTQETQAALDKSNGNIQQAVELLVAAAEARELYKAERKAAKKERIAKERQLKLAEQQNVKAQRIAEEERSERENLARQEEEAERLRKTTRKAAKKERQRLSRQFKAGESSSSIDEIEDTIACETEAATVEEDEEQKKQRWREEARLQKERAALKREETKKKRREQFLKETEQQATERALFWKTYIDEETITVDLLLRLCTAEFCRVNPDVEENKMLKDQKVSQTLHAECRNAFRELFKDIIPQVVVKGVKQEDLKERTGVINHWEQPKKKFSVWLDTKKGKATQLVYLEPCNLEATSVTKSTTNKKKQRDPVVTIFIGSVYLSKCLLTDIFRSEVDRMKRCDGASALDSFLADLMEKRNQEEFDAKQREEEERLQEEAERQRRARRREQEEREWQERQAEFRRQKEAYKEYKRHNRGNHRFHGRTGHGPFCRCPECFFEKMFFGGAGGHPGFAFFFEGFHEDEYYSDDDDDQWDSRFNHMHEQEERKKLQDAADVLGVNVDAPQDEIKRVFRKKALKFHPDKFREENDEGMTKEECEEHFKELSNAYDCLYGQFE